MRSSERSEKAPRYLAHTSGDIDANIPLPLPPTHTRGGAGFQGRGGKTQPRGGRGGDIPKAMVYHPSYDKKRWRELRDKAVPMRDVLKRASGLGLNLPPPPCNVSKES